LFVAPGIVYELRRERHLPTQDRTAFREAAAIALASVFFSGGALLVLAAVRALWPSTMPDAREWIDHPHRYLVHHYTLVGRTLAIAVVLALAAAWLVSWLVTWEHRDATIRSQDTLWSLFHLKPGKLPYVSVKTSGGMIFEGPLLTHDASGDRADRHLVIGPQALRGEVGKKPQPAPPGWDLIVVGLESVDHMYVNFDGDPLKRNRRDEWRTWWGARPRRNRPQVG
jgi:hypothetical protein